MVKWSSRVLWEHEFQVRFLVPRPQKYMSLKSPKAGAFSFSAPAERRESFEFGKRSGFIYHENYSRSANEKEEGRYVKEKARFPILDLQGRKGAQKKEREQQEGPAALVGDEEP